VLAIDPGNVTTIRIDDPAEKSQVLLAKTGSRWEVVAGDKRYEADSSVVRNILTQLNDLSTKQYAGSGKKVWEKYMLTDTSAMSVTLEAGRRRLARIYLGRISYTPPPQATDQQMPRQQDGEMATFVRVDGEQEVYSVEGFVRMNFNRKPEDYRNKKLSTFNRDDLTRVTFRYPGETMVLQKSGKRWLLDGNLADSVKAARYANALSRISHAFFADGAPAGAEASFSVTLEGNNFSPVTINAYPVPDTTTRYIFHSTYNPDAYFTDGKATLFKKIMVKREDLLPAVE
jgi:hypothetical protein